MESCIVRLYKKRAISGNAEQIDSIEYEKAGRLPVQRFFFWWLCAFGVWYSYERRRFSKQLSFQSHARYSTISADTLLLNLRWKYKISHRLFYYTANCNNLKKKNSSSRHFLCVFICWTRIWWPTKYKIVGFTQILTSFLLLMYLINIVAIWKLSYCLIPICVSALEWLYLNM